MVKQTKTKFEELNKNLNTSFTKANEGLRDSLNEAIGPKSSTNKEEMHGLIADKAKEAADKEQPAWKSIVKWVLIIAVVLVVEIGRAHV